MVCDAAAVAVRLGPLAVNFRHELSVLRHDRQEVPHSITDRDVTGEVASLAGIDTLQERSEQIFEEEVNRISISSTTAMICGVIGTAIFWTLMSGPVIALYRGYFDASFLAIRDLAGDLDRFPKPDFAMLLTSLILSILPTALFAMAVMAWAQGRRRVETAEETIRQRHRETIVQLQNQGVLRLHWDEPLLADAEFLLSAGAPDQGNAT